MVDKIIGAKDSAEAEQYRQEGHLLIDQFYADRRVSKSEEE